MFVSQSHAGHCLSASRCLTVGTLTVTVAVGRGPQSHSQSSVTVALAALLMDLRHCKAQQLTDPGNDPRAGTQLMVRPRSPLRQSSALTSTSHSSATSWSSIHRSPTPAPPHHPLPFFLSLLSSLGLLSALQRYSPLSLSLSPSRPPYSPRTPSTLDPSLRSPLGKAQGLTSFPFPHQPSSPSASLPYHVIL